MTNDELITTFAPLTNWQTIEVFHRRFGLDAPSSPIQLDDETFQYRAKFLAEELEEFHRAHQEKDLAGQIDALVDIVVVAMGTAYIAGFDWEKHWNEVYEANLRKERANGHDDPRSKRKNSLDIVKPEGWIGPDHDKFLR